MAPVEGGRLDPDKVTYYPEFFHRTSIAEARKVILTEEDAGMTVDKRWEVETKWLVERIRFDDDDSLIVDYGCGIGRLAKELKNPVLGVDISPTMRVHSECYVQRDTFGAMSPQMFKVLSENGLRVDGVMAIWALQHVKDVHETIDLLMATLCPGGVFWMLDLCTRYVPYKTDDGVIGFLDDYVRFLPTIAKWCVLEKFDVLHIYEHDVQLRKYRRKQHEG